MVKHICILALIYLVLGMLLLAGENYFLLQSEKFSVVFGIVGVGTAFFAFSLVEIFMLNRFRSTQPESVLTLGMTFKGFRFLFTTMALLISAFSSFSTKHMLCLNILAFYLTTLTYMTITNVKNEK